MGLAKGPPGAVISNFLYWEFEEVTRSGGFQRAKIAHFKGLLPRFGAGSTGQRNTRPKSFNRNVLAMRAARGLPTSGSH